MRLKYLCTSYSTALTQSEVSDSGPFAVYGAAGIVGYLSDYSYAGEYLSIIKDGAGVGRVAYCNPKTSLLGTMAYIIPNDKSNINWLKYVLISLDLGNSVSKTTIPHIYFSDYGKREIPYVNLTTQQKIAAFLDSKCTEIDSVLARTRTSIEEYKKLKQAVITQAVTKGIRGKRTMKDSGIEWIGQIPEDWNVQRIKTIFTLRDERNHLPLDEVNLISLYTDRGVVQHSDLESTTGNKASNADGYKLVYEDDIVVNIILCWMGAIGRSDYNGVTSPAYDVYKPSDGIDSRFYHHYFRTTGFNGDCYKRGRGIMAMRWRTYSDQFRDIKVVVPPLQEQREILGYLDKTCVEIDALIAKKEQYLVELENYKKSLIYEYVTGKKVVPNHGD